jgi:hypothetical protein
LGFFGGNKGEHGMKAIQNKPKRHPKSLLKPESIAQKFLAINENIFDIIMPWKVELAEETKKKERAKEKKSTKQTSLTSFIKNANSFGAQDYKGIKKTKEGDHDSEDEREKLKELARVIKLKEVESTDFK